MSYQPGYVLKDRYIIQESLVQGSMGEVYRAEHKTLHRQIDIMRGVEKRKLVAVVDEGHLLDREMLEEIRFLLNYRMDSENPLALILSGQQELWDKLKKQAYRAIRNRVDIQCFLHPYEYARMKNYIDSQMA